jgi:hypothetical protein
MNRTFTIAALAAVAAFTLTGCEDPNAAPVRQGNQQHQPFQQASETPSPTETPGAHPNKQTLKLTLRITSKQCFGSAGCNVEYRVAPVWTATPGVDLDGDYDITYKVTGDDSGPILDTLTIYSNGKYEVPFEGLMSTSSGAVHPTATIIRIRKHVGF